MNFWKQSSIKVKTIMVFSSIMVLLVTAMSVVGYFWVKNTFLEQANEQLSTLSQLMGQSLETKYLDFVAADENQSAHRFYKEELTILLRKSEVTNTFIFNAKYDVLVTAQPHYSKAQLMLNQDEIGNLAVAETATSFPFKDSNDNWYIWGFYRLNENYYFGIRESVERLETLNELSTTFIIIGSLGILLTILGGWFIAHVVSDPVDKLVNFSEKIGSGDFTAMPPSDINGEFSILKNTMMQMQQDLATKNDEREQMLAQIAHEIRNPLGGIELLAGLIKEDVEKDSPVHSHSTKILREVSGLKEQIASFLYYNRPVEARKEKIDVGDLFGEVKESLSKTINQKKIKFSSNVSEEIIEFDRQHLKQVLLNLLSNSLDAVKTKGSVELNIKRNGSGSLIEIIDNGLGVKPEISKNLFKPFYTTKASGSGLGLAISKKLCQENNAVLEYDSTYLQATRFTIRVL